MIRALSFLVILVYKHELVLNFAVQCLPKDLKLLWMIKESFSTRVSKCFAMLLLLPCLRSERERAGLIFKGMYTREIIVTLVKVEVYCVALEGKL